MNSILAIFTMHFTQSNILIAMSKYQLVNPYRIMRRQILKLYVLRRINYALKMSNYAQNNALIVLKNSHFSFIHFFDIFR